MAYLSDTDIMSWNDRLNSGQYYIVGRYSNSSSWPTLVFTKNRILNNNGDVLEIGEPEIDFRFTFSVAENRQEDFRRIFDRLSSEGFENYVRKGNGSYAKLKFEERVAKSVKKTDHTILKKKFARFEYSFHGEASSVMAYVALLEQSMEFLSAIWGYTEDGEEQCLLDFVVGDIVSPVKDLSRDMLVIDYEYRRVGTEYIVNYMVCEMLHLEGSPVVRYGETAVFGKGGITWSRNGRIDQILN